MRYKQNGKAKDLPYVIYILEEKKPRSKNKGGRRALDSMLDMNWWWYTCPDAIWMVIQGVRRSGCMSGRAMSVSDFDGVVVEGIIKVTGEVK